MPKRLVKEREWTEFAKLAKDISKEQGQFVLPSSLYSKYDELHLDEIAKHLMPPDSNPELVPVIVIGDGNSLFWSISLVLFKDEDHHCHLRVRSSMDLICNIHAYTKQHTIDNMAEYSYNKSVEYILQVYISNYAFGTDMERSLKTAITLGAKNGRDTLIFQLLAASNFFKKVIISIYPKHGILV